MLLHLPDTHPAVESDAGLKAINVAITPTSETDVDPRSRVRNGSPRQDRVPLQRWSVATSPGTRPVLVALFSVGVNRVTIGG